MKLVIIGYGPAAVKALESISNLQNSKTPEKLDVTIISAEKEKPYAPMFLLDYALGKRNKNELGLVTGFDQLSINEILGSPVREIQDRENKVLLADGREVQYDRLLIASGASPVKPSINGIEKKGVLYLNRLADARQLSRRISKISQVLIIGGGAIGIEAASSLAKLGKKVTIIEQQEHVLLPVLDGDICGYLENKLIEQGIQLILNNSDTAIIGDEGARGVIAGKKEIAGDLVLITAGIKPNLDFLKSSRIRKGRGILVDDYLQTSVPNIFAAGDVAESRVASGSTGPVFTWHSAIEQGWVAGWNLVNKQKTFQYCPGLVSLKSMGFPVVSIGSKSSQSTCHLLKYADEKKGIWERIYIKGNVIESYQALGITDRSGTMYEFIRNRKDIGSIKDSLSYGKANSIWLMSK
jgi:nitrite reductase (NADH) large subunit